MSWTDWPGSVSAARRSFTRSALPARTSRSSCRRPSRPSTGTRIFARARRAAPSSPCPKAPDASSHSREVAMAYDYKKHFGEITLTHDLLSRREERTWRLAAPPREGERHQIVLYLGCNVLRTSHMIQTVTAIFDR